MELSKTQKKHFSLVCQIVCFSGGGGFEGEGMVLIGWLNGGGLGLLFYSSESVKVVRRPSVEDKRCDILRGREAEKLRPRGRFTSGGPFLSLGSITYCLPEPSCHSS